MSESHWANPLKEDVVSKEVVSGRQRGCERRLCESMLITIGWLLVWEELKEDTFPYNSTHLSRVSS